MAFAFLFKLIELFDFSQVSNVYTDADVIGFD